jgi:hypothetical protein
LEDSVWLVDSWEEATDEAVLRTTRIEREGIQVGENVGWHRETFIRD